MSNHPWRASTHMFKCPPECPDRKPGCQDHCEQHAKDMVKWEERRKLELDRRHLDNYVTERVVYYRDRKAKSAKHSALYKTPSNKD